MTGGGIDTSRKTNGAFSHFAAVVLLRDEKRSKHTGDVFQASFMHPLYLLKQIGGPFFQIPYLIHALRILFAYFLVHYAFARLWLILR